MLDDILSLAYFYDPPDQYGIVSFYWWVGDKLEKDRLLWQLEQLSNMDICGLQINYCHRDEGGRIYGQPYESDPKQFTEEWWALFGWFMEEAEKRGISVSVSDYTLGAPGQGYYTDEILRERPDLRGGVLFCKTAELVPGEIFCPQPDCERVCLYAYPLEGGLPAGEKAVSLKVGETFRAGDRAWRLADISCRVEDYSIDPMHPGMGEEVVRHFFQRFEDRNPGKSGKALNFFFSDELTFGVQGNLWNEAFPTAFRARKGYDILPLLYAVFADIGPITQKVRLDYYDVVVSLEEENYFAPIYAWHEARGMTYGCDHGGRGYDLTEFGDYFRTQKYNQGPGCDQPGLASDIVKNKVASSISHLYDRPRTWLEGFYGSGWGTSGAQVLDAVCRNFAMGHNLLSLHGLYYTTYGGFWEWAPPCNHFRMPYWKQMKPITAAVKRMAYLNTRGLHCCDVAILYPVAAVEGGLCAEEAVEAAFELGRYLYTQGVDFDYMDFQSLNRAEIREGKLYVGDRSYRAVVVPSMRTIRYETLLKLKEFGAAGGLCLCLGSRPEASERAGREDAMLNELVDALFENRTVSSPEEVLSKLDASFPRDFRVLDQAEAPYFQHRRTDLGDFYFLYGLPENTTCFFRAKGHPVLLDPTAGKAYRLPAGRPDGEGTRLGLPLGRQSCQVILFSKEEPDLPVFPRVKTEKELPMGEIWQCDLVPTLDNTYGDFAQPPVHSKIGPQIRRAVVDGQRRTLGFAPYCEISGPVPPAADFSALEQRLLADPDHPCIPFQDYIFSMRYGREDDPGHQGWHGLKGKVTDQFLTFGKQVDCHQQYRYEEELPGGVYYMTCDIWSDKKQRAALLTGGMEPDKVYVNGREVGTQADLRAGCNRVLARYPSAGRGYLVFQREKPRPFVQTLPLSMQWYQNPNILPFVGPRPGEQRRTITFETPPACRRLLLRAAGEPSVRIDGRPAFCKRLGPDRYEVQNPACKPGPAQVELSLFSEKGYYDAAALLDYIDCVCDTGVIQTGDWGGTEGLAFYSGGLRYTQEITLPALAKGRRARLCLGEVASAALVEINGRQAGALAAPPYEIDVTGLVREGENILSVTVYNTLYNHYRTIPTRYNAPQKSGLIGPVCIRIGREESD